MIIEEVFPKNIKNSNLSLQKKTEIQLIDNTLIESIKKEQTNPITQFDEVETKKLFLNKKTEMPKKKYYKKKKSMKSCTCGGIIKKGRKGGHGKKGRKGSSKRSKKSNYTKKQKSIVDIFAE